MEIKVLGTGCKNCIKLEALVKEVVEELNIEANIIKEEEIDKIVEYGVMRTPALVIDEKLVLQGGIPSKKKMIKIIKN